MVINETGGETEISIEKLMKEGCLYKFGGVCGWGSETEIQKNL